MIVKVENSQQVSKVVESLKKIGYLLNPNLTELKSQNSYPQFIQINFCDQSVFWYKGYDESTDGKHVVFNEVTLPTI